MNVYFGVHPTAQRGGVNERSRTATIAVVNCLFAEFDEDKGATSELIENLKPVPSVVISSGGGWHCYWLLTEPFYIQSDDDRENIRTVQAAWVGFTGGDPGAKDLARVLRLPETLNGKYNPPRLVEYRWIDLNLRYKLDALALQAQVDNLTAEISRVASAKLEDRNNAPQPRYLGEDILQQALKKAPGNRNDAGFWLACQLRDNQSTQVEAELIMLEYARRVTALGDHPYTETEARASLREAYAAPTRMPWQSRPSNGNGYHKPEPPQTIVAPAAELRELPTTTPTPGFYKLDDIGNGERLAVRHGARMRYVNEWGWMIWNGKVWEHDRDNVAAWAKETARSIYAEVAAYEDDGISNALKNHASKTAGRERRAAMIDAAKSEPGISAKPEDFDRDPWALNVQNGILDLKTGKLRPHEPSAMMTRLSGAIYDTGARCPKWESFLDRIFAGDSAVIGFIKRAFGYSLTGNTGAQVMFFPYGTGANGKSVTLGVLQAVLGDYATKAPTDTLMVKYFGSGIPNDLARLAGARAVIAAELAKGKHLNESLVKDLTGGDPITARYLRQEFFEYLPAFKLWMYGNHKPIVRGTDDGIWRRIKLIPFSVTIPEPERDPVLLDKLRAELPGILAWAVRGCMEWQQEGLRSPASVEAATAAYRKEQDVISAFLAECCLTGPGFHVTAGVLHTAYKNWGGELNQQDFREAMVERGYVTYGRQGGTGRALIPGLGLVDPEMGKAPKSD
jgi:putative DNA primase/helicase